MRKTSLVRVDEAKLPPNTAKSSGKEAWHSGSWCSQASHANENHNSGPSVKGQTFTSFYWRSRQAMLQCPAEATEYTEHVPAAHNASKTPLKNLTFTKTQPVIYEAGGCGAWTVGLCREKQLTACCGTKKTRSVLSVWKIATSGRSVCLVCSADVIRALYGRAQAKSDTCVEGSGALMVVHAGQTACRR